MSQERLDLGLGYAKRDRDRERVKRPGSCIIAVPGDRRTLCGKRTADVGVCWAKFVQAHTDGHNQEWCEPCLDVWRQTA